MTSSTTQAYMSSINPTRLEIPSNNQCRLISMPIDTNPTTTFSLTKQYRDTVIHGEYYILIVDSHIKLIPPGIKLMTYSSEVITIDDVFYANKANPDDVGTDELVGTARANQSDYSDKGFEASSNVIAVTLNRPMIYIESSTLNNGIDKESLASAHPDIQIQHIKDNAAMNESFKQPIFYRDGDNNRHKHSSLLQVGNLYIAIIQ